MTDPEPVPTTSRARPRPAALRLATFVSLGVALAACGGDDDGDAAADAAPVDAAPTTGHFTMRWSVADPEGVPLACADVDGASVRIEATPLDGLEGFVESFACATGEGGSGPHAPGHYRLAIDLRSTSGDSLLAAPAVVADLALAVGEVSDAGAVAFAVEALGTASFRIDAAGAGPSCATVGDGGVGVVGTTIELARGGQCLDGVELAIAAGAGGGSAGTYVTDCASPPLAPCIENDQTIELAELRSGPITVDLTGYLAGEGGGDPVACFGRVGGHTIPGNHLEGELGTLVLQRSAAPACAEAPGP